MIEHPHAITCLHSQISKIAGLIRITSSPQRWYQFSRQIYLDVMVEALLSFFCVNIIFRPLEHDGPDWSGHRPGYRSFCKNFSREGELLKAAVLAHFQNPHALLPPKELTLNRRFFWERSRGQDIVCSVPGVDLKQVPDARNSSEEMIRAESVFV